MSRAPAPVLPDLGRHTRGAPGEPPATYGTCMRLGGSWLIECEAHVMIRLKRWFGRVDPTETNQVRLRRSPEIDRDLQAFLDRFPLEMTESDLADMHHGAETHRNEAKLIARVLSGAYDPREYPMAEPPRDYQRIAADLWLRRKSLLLGDDLGLGKTVSAIAGLSDPATRPALVVCPPHLTGQWRKQLERFLPGLRVHVLAGTRPYDIPEAMAKQERKEGKTPGQGMPDVCIVNYFRISGWAGSLGWVKSVVYDEVQELRHADTDRYRAARSISGTATFRLGLSATPIYNYGAEYFTVQDVVEPGCLGTREEFVRDWCTAGEEARKQKVKDPRAFGLYLREGGHMLRRTRQEVGRELLPLTIVPHHIDADLKALEAVRSSATELARVILRQRGASPNDGFEKMQASGKLDQVIRQATGVAKAPYVADFVRLLAEQGEKVLLFGWHREFWRIIAEKLKDMNPVFFTGEESDRQKQATLKSFLDPAGSPIIGISLRAGSAGLDGLQHVCRTVVIGELDWSPKVHDQGIARVNRDGQLQPVFGYYLLSDVGSDPIVADVCGLKRSQSDPIVDPDSGVLSQQRVDPDHIKKLAESWLNGQGSQGRR